MAPFLGALLLAIAFALALPLASAVPALKSNKWIFGPTVTITKPNAIVIGASANNVDSFDGIPFALPPTGPLRLKPPQPIQKPLGIIQATSQARSCPQFLASTATSHLPNSILANVGNIPIFQEIANTGEDCLTVNVRRPAGTKPDAKLPVLVWIFGGGFETGSTSMYDGASVVTDSVALGMPVIYVAMNYRLGGFGFLPGAEVLKDGSANLGLLDQRLALEWVADNIASFGGDPTKVTIWGESAGAISVFNQMALYDGDNIYNGSPLFRGAIMNSGSIAPANPVDCVKGQAVYDTVVRNSDCKGASDTLSCLRGLDYTKFLNAVNSVPGVLGYNSVAESYLPRPDGKLLTDSPERLVIDGKYAAVPFINGDQEDEGTIFALYQTNLTTTNDLVDYFQNLYFFDASRQQITDLVATYQNNTLDGSPFRSGDANNWYPQFKRLSAILGDISFTLTRRAFLNSSHKSKPGVPSWSYLSSYGHNLPFLGTFHGSDILQLFFGFLPNYASKAMQSYYLSFVYDQDPNARAGNYMNWPQWSGNHSLMQFFDDHGALLSDDFRQDTYEVLTKDYTSFRV
ncbi:Carboxylesterase [Penicillium brevicompactum]|uniref:Carboxylesterase type B n=1 Tax=Penicillium brevicompactum TaxID=5074 RepID=UPI00254227DD|nr:Carboxylesterase type B [Penicillium brevicompactum]KAJ5337237.1 Carboxylesterase type B [Penicillium brevicompactum]